MALAMVYSEPEKGGRGKKSSKLKSFPKASFHRRVLSRDAAKASGGA
jgi:hypothetical protein